MKQAIASMFKKSDGRIDLTRLNLFGAGIVASAMLVYDTIKGGAIDVAALAIYLGTFAGFAGHATTESRKKNVGKPEGN